jgi:hypothetical protein
MRLIYSCFLFTLLVHPSCAQRLVWERLYRSNSSATYTEYMKEGVISSANRLFFAMSAGGTIGNQRSHFYLINAVTSDSIWQRTGLRQSSGEQGVRLLPNGRVGFMTEEGDASANAQALYMQQFRGNGTVTSRFRYPTPQPIFGGEIARSLVLMADGSYTLTSSRGYTPRDGYHLLNIDSLGTVQWMRNYAWGINDRFIDAQREAGGTLLLYGLYWDGNTSGPDVKLMRLATNGDSLQAVRLRPSRTTGNLTANSLNRILPLRDGSTMIFGRADTAITTGSAAVPWALKVDAQLRPRWTYVHRPGTSSLAYAQYLRGVELQDGSVLILAQQVGSQQPIYELHHLSATGGLLQAYPFTTQLCNGISFSTLVPEPGTHTIFVGGGCISVSGGAYLARLELPATLPALVTAARPAAAPAPSFALFPNPATHQAHLRLAAPLPAGAELCLYSPLGQLVRRYATPRTGSLTLPLAGLPAGTYLARLLGPEGQPLGAAERLVVLP